MSVTSSACAQNLADNISAVAFQSFHHISSLFTHDASFTSLKTRYIAWHWLQGCCCEDARRTFYTRSLHWECVFPFLIFLWEFRWNGNGHNVVREIKWEWQGRGNGKEQEFEKNYSRVSLSGDVNFVICISFSLGVWFWLGVRQIWWEWEENECSWERDLKWELLGYFGTGIRKPFTQILYFV